MFCAYKLRLLIYSLALVLFCSICSSKALADRALENVTLSVYIDPLGAPNAFFEDDFVVMKGLDVDIIHELQRRLGFSLKDNRIYPLQREPAFAKLRDGSADIVGGSMSWTKERSMTYDCTPIYYSSSLAILYNKENTIIDKLKDIKGKRIGVQPGATSEGYVKSFGGIPVEYDNLTFGMFAVSEKEIDGFLYDKPPIADFAKSLERLNLAVSSEPFGEESCQFTFMLAKGAPHNALIIKTMQDMLDDGTIQKLLDKWGAE